MHKQESRDSMDVPRLVGKDAGLLRRSSSMESLIVNTKKPVSTCLVPTRHKFRNGNPAKHRRATICGSISIVTLACLGALAQGEASLLGTSATEQKTTAAPARPAI